MKVPSSPEVICFSSPTVLNRTSKWHCVDVILNELWSSLCDTQFCSQRWVEGPNLYVLFSLPSPSGSQPEPFHGIIPKPLLNFTTEISIFFLLCNCSYKFYLGQRREVRRLSMGNSAAWRSVWHASYNPTVCTDLSPTVASSKTQTRIDCCD